MEIKFHKINTSEFANNAEILITNCIHHIIERTFISLFDKNVFVYSREFQANKIITEKLESIYQVQSNNPFEPKLNRQDIGSVLQDRRLYDNMRPLSAKVYHLHKEFGTERGNLKEGKSFRLNLDKKSKNFKSLIENKKSSIPKENEHASKLVPLLCQERMEDDLEWNKLVIELKKEKKAKEDYIQNKKEFLESVDRQEKINFDLQTKFAFSHAHKNYTYSKNGEVLQIRNLSLKRKKKGNCSNVMKSFDDKIGETKEVAENIIVPFINKKQHTNKSNVLGHQILQRSEIRCPENTGKTKFTLIVDEM